MDEKQFATALSVCNKRVCTLSQLIWPKHMKWETGEDNGDVHFVNHCSIHTAFC